MKYRKYWEREIQISNKVPKYSILQFLDVDELLFLIITSICLLHVVISIFHNIFKDFSPYILRYINTYFCIQFVLYIQGTASRLIPALFINKNIYYPN